MGDIRRGQLVGTQAQTALTAALQTSSPPVVKTAPTAGHGPAEGGGSLGEPSHGLCALVAVSTLPPGGQRGSQCSWGVVGSAEQSHTQKSELQ